MTMLQGLRMVIPSVYVLVRQLGAWKLHPYSSIALISAIYNHPKFAQLAHYLEKLNFAVMTAMAMLVSNLSS